MDPTTKLQRLLKDLNENVDMLEMLSLGRGQGPRIEEILRNAMQRGKWVFLQNCHLGHSWLQNLQKVVHRFVNKFVKRDTRNCCDVRSSASDQNGLPNILVVAR